VRKLIIDARLNEYTGREANPNVPFSPEEIARDAEACRQAGASIVHYHARDPETGAVSTDVDLYCETSRRVRDVCDAVILPTLGANTFDTVDERFAHVDAMAADPATRADIVPLDLATTNLAFRDPSSGALLGDDLAYVNTLGLLKQLAERTAKVGAVPMSALWSVGSLRLMAAMLETGVLPQPHYAELSLTEGGLLAGHPGSVAGLEAYLAFWPEDLRCTWGVLCFGGSLLPVLDAIIDRGGHVAIGLGDYAYPELGTPSNADIVASVAERARSRGREVATPDELREWLASG